MQPGTSIKGRYEITGELGKGGMGTVYGARDLAMNRDVAIKVFRETMTAEALRRAQREAITLAKVDHPNLVRVHSFETDENGSPMLVFDLVEGKALSDILKERKLDREQVLELFQQLCSGLQELHRNGIIHRDIKPSNLMVSDCDDGKLQLKIIDFGLAKSTEQTSQRLTATGTLLGTPTYMSPEQFRAEQLTPQSDLYSAACVVYEMIQGAPPFPSESPYAVASSHATDPVPPVPNAPELDAFFQKAMAKLPNERYGSADAMFEGFKHPSSAEPVIAPQRKAGAKKINRGVLIGIAVVALIGIAATAIQRESPHAPSINVEQEAAEACWTSDRYYKDRYSQALKVDAEAIQRLENHPGAGRNMAKLYDFYAIHSSRPPEKSKYKPRLDVAQDAIAKAIALETHFQQTPPDRATLANYYMHQGGIFGAAGKYQQAYDSMKTACTIRGIKPAELTFQERSAFIRALQELHHDQELHEMQ